ncbi:MAG: hypothetical protein E6J42_11670 [Chloroflexi bacterium]|nr:MAG: hypothetical protein E6J42_11670 [Chloroflexota bacterium]
MPPLDGAAHARAEAFAFGRRHVNPVLIFGITLFGLGAVYLALVVALRAQPILFPGQQPGLGPLAPLVPVDQEPDVADAQQRINILFLGLDLRRDESDDTPARTDTVFVLTIDPYSKTAGILSIPRDLAVDIPDGSGGVVNDRINTAFERGEMRKPGSGPGLAVETVEKMFKDEIHQDVPIDYYVVLNFNNFIDIIDELDGIDVNVPEYVYDPAYNDCGVPARPTAHGRQDGSCLLSPAQERQRLQAHRAPAARDEGGREEGGEP